MFPHRFPPWPGWILAAWRAGSDFPNGQSIYRRIGVLAFHLKRGTCPDGVSRVGGFCLVGGLFGGGVGVLGEDQGGGLDYLGWMRVFT
ncbi:hypothetical protein BS50DRAFT_576706 [Corynespora cassiicola Philippines]|uniref:Uncharacterized protein n=1 Tax=Corynespora cassiicola Philippines TaxID=1448308 RepID=A0A2T2NGC9_CORCC|nr:hypothetical protein BS50DRAFT_576706 [Corynespora cassiicola Philippines]